VAIKEKWKRFRPLPPDLRRRLEGLGELFAAEGILLVYLFGSLARAEEGNDVDLAILPGPQGLTELQEKLCEVLGTQRLELVNLQSAPLLLRFEVIREGVVLYRRDEDTENSFELATLKEYQDMAYWRRRHRAVLKERTEQWLSNKSLSPSGSSN